jgi:hypothetical protein
VATLDSILFWLEVLLVPASLGLLLAASGHGRSRPPLWLVVIGLLAITAYLGSLWYLAVIVPAAGIVFALARLADPRPRLRLLAVPLTLLAALTVAQPFGVRADPVYAARQQPWTGGEPADPTGTHTEKLLDLSILRFRLYRRDRFDPAAGLGECCPPTHDLRIRSWIPPGLMTNGTQVFGLCGDSPCWDPEDPSTRGTVRLVRNGDTWYAIVERRGLSYAWRLSGGVTSRPGVLYWLFAALGIGSLVYRRARL